MLEFQLDCFTLIVNSHEVSCLTEKSPLRSDSNTIARRLSKVLDVMATGEPSSEETLKLIESEVPDNLGDNIDYGNGVGNDDLRVYGGAEDGHGGDNDDDEVSELSDGKCSIYQPIALRVVTMYDCIYKFKGNSNRVLAES